MSGNHLVTVWNPSYADEPLEAHLQVLLKWNARAASDECDEENVYVWWGKVRSSHRLQPMPHLKDVLAMSESLAMSPESYEMHLYITDYRSLYVADVEYITEEDPRTSDSAHVPPYYSERKLNCDFWFRLRDIRSLVREDLMGVAAELAKLRNIRYHKKSVSLYGGMVELPLIVSRSDDRLFFQDKELELLADGLQLWAQFDAEQGGVGAMEATLRDDHLGERAWNGLDPAARRFVATAERTLREHRSDPTADLAPVVLGYAKAFEVQINQILAVALADAPPEARYTNMDGRSVLITDNLPLSIGQLSLILSKDKHILEHLKKVLNDGDWFTCELPALLNSLKDPRNRAAHGDTITRTDAVKCRNRLLGVGFPSEIGRLALVSLKSKRV